MNTAIILTDIRFAYGDGSHALESITLGIERGERVALIGPNGAGKSTLLLHLNGILRGQGRITIEDLPLCDEHLYEIRRRVGLIFQEPNDQLFCPTVREDIAFGPMHFHLDRDALDETVEKVLRDMDLLDVADRAAHHLSVGERRRVSIAAVLACKPHILALDEPAAALDPKRRRWLVDFLLADTRTIILATHDLAFARSVCQRAILMNAGRIVADGPIDTILEDRALLEKNDL